MQGRRGLRRELIRKRKRKRAIKILIITILAAIVMMIVFRFTVMGSHTEGKPEEIKPEPQKEVQRVVKPAPKEQSIPSMDWDAEESYLLAKIAMAEAEGECIEGKAMVILTVLNRVWSTGFPDTIEEVILQERNGTYQFSPVEPGGRWWEVEPDQECWDALHMVMVDHWDESGGALYFEAAYNGEDTWHSRNLKYIKTVGNHNFYK